VDAVIDKDLASAKLAEEVGVDIFLIATLIERKLRICQRQGVKDEAVVIYCEPLRTPAMAYHRLSRRVNKMKI